MQTGPRRSLSGSGRIKCMDTQDRGLADLKDMYSEVGQAWRQFLDWREKIIAGYLTVIAAIATAIHVSASDQPGLLLSAVLISVVFWIFDFRDRILLGVCQRAGESIEQVLRPKTASANCGCYSALMSLRRPRREPWRIDLLTHGLAVDALVSGIITVSLGRLLAISLKSSNWSWVMALIGAVFFAILVVLLQVVGHLGRLTEEP